MKEKILITSALPYANGPLHFGHIAGAYLPADCYARFQRLMKNDVLYICGSDEYGVAITMSADLAKRSPQEHVDIYHEVLKGLFDKLNFSMDHYSITTCPGHKGIVQQFFKELYANGHIEERITEQLYSEKDNKFLADRYVVGTCPSCGHDPARGDECPKCGASYEATDLKNPRSKMTGATLIRRETKHWFLRLDHFKDKLDVWLQQKKWKSNVVNFIKGFINDLHARSITRDSTWGIPIPLEDTDGKVLYVWFDAPIGYLSATQEWGQKQGNSELWKDYWCDPKTKLVQFIGKDNITFHAAIFPAMVMGQDQPYKLVDELPANEFYNLEGRQFSKSEGWYIDLEDFFTKYTPDQIRYAIAANAPETADSEFTWKDFQVRCNSELVGKYGNLVNRVMVFARNQCAGKIPVKQLHEFDVEFLSQIKKLAEEAKVCYETFRVRRASQIVMELAQLGNAYFDRKHPWLDAKNEETRSVMETTIACCFECIKVLALISSPIMPEASNKIWAMIGQKDLLEKASWKDVVESELPTSQVLCESTILFQKIENEQIEQEIKKLHELSKELNPQAAVAETAVEAQEVKLEYAPMKDPIDIQEFFKIDLRVAEIKSAENLPKSKKLLLLKVSLGFEERTIVSGISLYYKPEELIGKKVVIVANLKPAVLMGVESQGMVLAGSIDKSVELVSIQNLPAGSIVS